MDEQPTIQQFIDRHPITLALRLDDRSKHYSGRYYRISEGFYRRIYTVTLGYQGRTMTLPFYCGDSEPELEDILDCLGSDCQCISGIGVYEFCRSLGYGWVEGSRVYHAIEAERRDLLHLLGRGAYRRLVFGTERL